VLVEITDEYFLNGVHCGHWLRHGLELLERIFSRFFWIYNIMSVVESVWIEMQKPKIKAR